MAHNLSWIDPDELRTLVSETAYRRPEELPPDASVSVSVSVSAPARADAAEPADRAAAPPVVASASPLRPGGSVRRASRPSLPNPDAPVPAPPPPRTSSVETFRPDPAHPLETRLEQLMMWACRVTGLSRVFIADAEGLLVASLNTGSNAVDDAASAVDLCTRAVPSDIAAADAGVVTMLVSGRTHVVAWDLTRHGKTFIALSGAVDPNTDALSNLSRALRDALR